VESGPQWRLTAEEGRIQLATVRHVQVVRWLRSHTSDEFAERFGHRILDLHKDVYTFYDSVMNGSLSDETISNRVVSLEDKAKQLAEDIQEMKTHLEGNTVKGGLDRDTQISVIDPMRSRPSDEKEAVTRQCASGRSWNSAQRLGVRPSRGSW